MKGGGFLILFFLLICFLWGIASVVGSISRLFSSKFESRPQAEKSMVARGRNPDSPMSEQSPQAATEHPIQDDLDHGLTQLERISKLRKEGALTEDEFTQIKEMLIKKRQQT